MSAFENVVPVITYHAAIPIQAADSPSQIAVVPVAPATAVADPKPVRAKGTRRKPVVLQPPPAIGFTHSDPADPAGPPIASPGPHFQQKLNFGPQAVASPDQNSEQKLNTGPPPVDIHDPHFQLNFGPPMVALDAGVPLLAPELGRSQLPVITSQKIVAPDGEHGAVPRQQTMVPVIHFFREAPRPQQGAIIPPRNMGEPLVWAHKRQQLCEVLPYYNAYQSGVYMSGGIIHSMMIDGESRPQDIFTNEIIITRW